MKKLILILILLLLSYIFVSSCGTLLNHKKPILRDDRALSDAYKHRVVDEKYYYYLCNLSFLVFFPIGLGVTAIFMTIDNAYNNAWQITDKEKVMINGK